MNGVSLRVSFVLRRVVLALSSNDTDAQNSA